MVSYNKRAVHPDQKLERRDVIVQAALERFQRPTFEALTMAEIARGAGVSKGTLYLYFKSKEELFLQALLELYQDWFQTFERVPEDVVEHLVETLSARPKLVELMSMAPFVMEANADGEVVLAFKKQLAIGLERLSSVLNLEPRRLMWVHAVIVGLYSTVHPPPDVRRMIQQEPGLAHFQMDFYPELRALLKQIL